MNKNQNMSSDSTLPRPRPRTRTRARTWTRPTPRDEKSDQKRESKLSAKDRLLQKHKAGGSSGILSKLERMDMFDSTKASTIQTKDTSSLKSMAPAEDGMMISGRNVGAEQNEPDWKPEHLEFINKKTSVTLMVETVIDTRRRNGREYCSGAGVRRKGRQRLDRTTEEAYVSALDQSMYCIGIGPMKFNTTGSPKYYTDAVIALIDGSRLLSQWTSEWSAT
ncbi:MAG: hypothetical protein Q9207_005454 [Kuettlingeria erythrocarpa]